MPRNQTASPRVTGAFGVSQIKSRERVRDLAEVYTNPREVNAMLDLIPDMFPHLKPNRDLDHKFLEPACGNGNFLEEILRRKLLGAVGGVGADRDRFYGAALRALASIYAVDICAENVVESRARMIGVLYAHLEEHGFERTTGFESAAQTIVETNVQCANMLTDDKTLLWVDYQHDYPGRPTHFRPVVSRIGEDGVPTRPFVHFSQLSALLPLSRVEVVEGVVA